MDSLLLSSGLDSLQLLIPNLDSIGSLSAAWDSLSADSLSVDSIPITNWGASISEEGRFLGIPRETGAFNHNLLISILLFLSIGLTWFLLLQKETVGNWIRKMSDQLFSDNHKITLQDQFGEGLLLLVGLFGVSLLSCQILVPGQIAWLTVLYIWLLSIGFILVKLLIMQAYCSICFPKKSGLFIYKYLSLSAGFGFSCLFIFMGLYFTQDYLQVVWWVLAGLTLLSYFGSLSYVLIKYFFNQLDLIFHFILYLCTLELLPIFLIVKVAL